MQTNIIHNLDNRKGFELLESESIDMVITSPPYDNVRKYDTGIGTEWTWENMKPIANESLRVLKKGGVFVLVINDQTLNGSESLNSFRIALYFQEIGFFVHDTMIWEKDCIPQHHNRYEPSFEYMFVFSKGKPKTFNPIMRKNIRFGEKITAFTHASASKDNLSAVNGINKAFGKKLKEESYRKNIWYYPTGLGGSTSDKIAFEHPAIFPEKLVQDHVLSWSNENDIILDPFIGSGTTAKVCLQLKRKFIGFEISTEYCEIAKQRLNEYLAQTKIF